MAWNMLGQYRDSRVRSRTLCAESVVSVRSSLNREEALTPRAIPPLSVSFVRHDIKLHLFVRFEPQQLCASTTVLVLEEMKEWTSL